MKKLSCILVAVLLVFGIALSPVPALADETVDESQTTEASAAGTVTMYRLYNKYSGEHLYTKDQGERSSLVKAGWKDEGVAWVAPAKSDTPVRRMYNRYTGDHHYTTRKDEYDKCAELGWRKEGVGWYSADAATGEKLYRGFNSYETVGTHLYTASWSEMSTMLANGWDYEGVAWYGIPFSQISW